jgi:hypothetical protein
MAALKIIQEFCNDFKVTQIQYFSTKQSRVNHFEHLFQNHNLFFQADVCLLALGLRFNLLI